MQTGPASFGAFNTAQSRRAASPGTAALASSRLTGVLQGNHLAAETMMSYLDGTVLDLTRPYDDFALFAQLPPDGWTALDGYAQGTAGAGIAIVALPPEAICAAMQPPWVIFELPQPLRRGLSRLGGLRALHVTVPDARQADCAHALDFRWLPRGDARPLLHLRGCRDDLDIWVPPGTPVRHGPFGAMQPRAEQRQAIAA